MAKENDQVQHNNNNSNSSNSSNNNGMDALAASVGVTSTSNPTEPRIALSDFEMEDRTGDIVSTGDKSTVNSAGGDWVGTSSRNNHFPTSTTNFMCGKLNDLVADLCVNGPIDDSDNYDGYGDYTHSRSNNSGVNAHEETAMLQKNVTSTWEPVSSSISNQHVSQPYVAPTQNSSSFSFKHFLSSGPPFTAPSSTVTVTSLDTTASNNTNGTQNNNTSASCIGSTTVQASTGARPKVPQSASLSSTSISSLMTAGSSSGLSTTNTGGQHDGGNSFSTSATKMKRSPRFSSFDSQASLAEYVTVGADEEANRVSSTGISGVRGVGVGANASSGFRLNPQPRDILSTTSRVSRGMGDGGTGPGSSTNNTGEYGRNQYVPRSYSNYEMPMSSSSASPRRRTGAPSSVGAGGTGCMREARPTRLALNTNSSKSKGNLPLSDLNSGACGGAPVCTAPPVTRPLPSNAGEFPAAVLPDFVQDHWLDSWYAHDMHLNSPPNSPIRDFSNIDVTGGAIGGNGGGSGGLNGSVCDVAGGNGVSGGIGIPGPSHSYGGAGGGGATAEATASNAKMLPDFLSDGPIIHSSQRLADVAVGLPSNSIGSPDDPPITSQLSRLRIENERLQRELNDARMELNEQTRRANELERKLQTNELKQQQQQQQRPEELATAESVEGLADRSKRTRTTTATAGAGPQNYVKKVKQQVTQLTTELEALRRENEALREEGAVGGFNVSHCDRPRPFGTDAGGGNAAAGAGMRGAVGRPFRTQQFSRDLLRAASNAEGNLRQLLAGVDNLRQMAAEIENSETRFGCDVSPDLFSDFLDDCDDYEDYSDGPTL